MVIRANSHFANIVLKYLLVANFHPNSIISNVPNGFSQHCVSQSFIKRNIISLNFKKHDSK